MFVFPVFSLVCMTYYFFSNYLMSTNVYDSNGRFRGMVATDVYRYQPSGTAKFSTDHVTISKITMLFNSRESTETFRNSHIMICTGNGRLGNKMFEFASLLGIAKRHNYKPMILRGNSLLQVFDINQVTNTQPKNIKGVGERGAGVYDKSLESLKHDMNYSLGGFYQSWKYFDFIRDEVRKSFKFRASHFDKARQTQISLNVGDKLTVGVHVRRGDMNSKRELSRGYNVATKEYFTKAFQYFRDRFKHLMFLVVSDDLTWCKNNMKGDDVKYVSTGSAGSDMAFLAQCNHSIVSTGSFGWWGAYLAGGEVVYYRNFPSNNSWLLKQYNRTEYYPPRWVGME